MTEHLDKIVILLNGPPRCGKDTGGLAIHRCLDGSRVMKFTMHVKHATHQAYGLGLPIEDFEHFEPVKDVPRAEFFGLTPRQAYIAHAENYMKPLHGKDIIGKIFLNQHLVVTPEPVIIVADTGFVEEVRPTVDAVGPDRVLLVRVHAEKRGCNFERDSRSYIEIPGVASLDIENNAPDPRRFQRECLRAAYDFVRRCGPRLQASNLTVGAAA
jgi:hypothetical protein